LGPGSDPEPGRPRDWAVETRTESLHLGWKYSEIFAQEGCLMGPIHPARKQTLPPFLEEVFLEHHRPSRLSSDPLEFVHRFGSPLEQEAVALIAAQLAYGNVKQIRRSVEDWIRRVESSPQKTVENWVRSLATPEGIRAANRALQGFVHRFHEGEELTLLFRLLQRSWERFGSLGAHFVRGLSPDDLDITLALNTLLAEWRSWAVELNPGVAGGRAFGHFMSAPAQGSCCKRWCMFLRWMGRKDALDPGLWTAGAPLAAGFVRGRSLHSRQLILPLDTHTGRISQYLGLTNRKSLGWRAALEITEVLRCADPEDPVRFDFALSRLGILDLCQKRFRVEICRECQLLPVCIFAKSEMKLLRKTTRKP
jgi:uncharacterized protein (TIGR02757 family)